MYLIDHLGYKFYRRYRRRKRMLPDKPQLHETALPGNVKKSSLTVRVGRW
jgi:hypothetical protein